MPCSICNGSLHIRKGRSWVRCSCAKSITNSLYIKANIKCGELSYPTDFDNILPLTLKDFSCTGDYHAFRRMVWRSLNYYETVDLRYDYFDAYRLVEIYLGQDTEYGRVRDLDALGLVVTALGVSDLPNRMLAPLFCQLLTQRRMGGLPTWVYSSKTGSLLRSAYGNELADLLGTLRSSVYDFDEKPTRLSTSEKFIGS